MLWAPGREKDPWLSGTCCMSDAMLHAPCTRLSVEPGVSRVCIWFLTESGEWKFHHGVGAWFP